MKPQYFVLLVVLLATMTLRNEADSSGWVPIPDINDPHVIDTANFAVTEHDKQTGAKLKLDNVISGEKKVLVDQTTICLNITASDSAASNKYNIAVVEKLSFRNLTIFTLLQS